jgi:hypothetical protein
MRKFNIKTSFLYRVLICLLCLVLVSAALFYYIQAKYVSGGEDTSPEASITRWGFTANINGDNMFGEHYVGGEIETDTTLDDYSYDVRAKAETTVIAPDTSGYMSFSVKGSAEVDAQVVLKASGGDVKVTVKEDGYEYRPISWSLDVIDGANVTNEIKNGTLEELLERMEELNPIIKAGNTVDVEYRITWEWPLETGSTPEEKERNNTLDSVIAAYLARNTIDSTGNTIDSKYIVSASLKFDFIAAVEQVG